MAKRYLDIEGLQTYDALIKQYIEDANFEDTGFSYTLSLISCLVNLGSTSSVVSST